jgi:hypothetical protein
MVEMTVSRGKAKKLAEILAAAPLRTPRMLHEAVSD